MASDTAPTTWLIDPRHPATAPYVTQRLEVAQKRADKGDYVIEIERAGKSAEREDYAPYYRRLLPTKPVAPAPQPEEEDEL